MNCSNDFDLQKYNISASSYPVNTENRGLLLWEAVLKVVFYVIIFLIALFGNVMIIFIVYHNKKMRTTTNFYLVNLAIADVLIVGFCMWSHLVNNLTQPQYVLGEFMCKFNPFAQMTSLTASVLTLTVISCDRFIAVMFPLRARITQRRARLVITILWLTAIASAIPFLIYKRYIEVKWLDYTELKCTEIWPSVSWYDSKLKGCVYHYPGQTVYYTFVTVTLFFLPVLVMSVTYTLIVYRVWISQLPGERCDANHIVQSRAKKKVIKMVIVVIIIFIICWMPLQVLILYDRYVHSSHGTGVLPSWFQHFRYFSHFIAYSNSAFNPLIYGGFNQNFRRSFYNICRWHVVGQVFLQGRIQPGDTRSSLGSRNDYNLSTIPDGTLLSAKASEDEETKITVANAHI